MSLYNDPNLKPVPLPRDMTVVACYLCGKVCGVAASGSVNPGAKYFHMSCISRTIPKLRKD
jgi:hypothetical protein